MKNILLIDNCYLVRCALSNLINAHGQMRVAAAVTDWTEAGDRIKYEPVDIVVFDVSIPRKNALEIVSALKHLWHHLPILILGGQAQAEYAINFLKLGCAGYLTRNCGGNQVIEAIHAVVSGGTCVMPTALRNMVQSQWSSKSVLDDLSPREIQVFLKLALGKSTEYIARELNIAPSTISVFRTNILRKMRFSNNVDIIHYALDHHWVDISNQAV